MTDAELRALAERATRGEWRAKRLTCVERPDGEPGEGMLVPAEDGDEALVMTVAAGDTEVATVADDGDLEWIAAASPDRVIALLDRLRAAEQRAEEAEHDRDFFDAERCKVAIAHDALAEKLRRCVEALREIARGHASRAVEVSGCYGIARAALAEVEK